MADIEGTVMDCIGVNRCIVGSGRCKGCYFMKKCLRSAGASV